MIPHQSPHEGAILGAIAAGYRMDYLLGNKAWTPNDVAQTMRRHGLVSDTEGRIRRDTEQSVIVLALHSPSTHVRTKAKRAAAMMRELQGLLAGQESARDAEAERARQRAAIQRWQDWLKQAMAESRQELRRLNPNARRTAA